MSCTHWDAEIVERARAGRVAGGELSGHLRQCAACAAAWQEQVALTDAIRGARAVASDHRPGEFRRAQLMSEFDRGRRGRKPLRLLALASAAAVLVAALFVSRPFSPISVRNSEAANAVQGDASGDFLPVPYTAPLAEGESVEIIRAELSSAALGRMGLAVPAVDDPVAVDVLVGQDGVPRAVRFLDTSDSNF